MNTNYEEKIKLLDFENQIYLLLIFATLLNYDTNLKLKNLYLNNQGPNENIRDEYLLANYIGLFIFIVFLKRNINTLNDLEEGSKEYELAKLRVYSSYLFIMGQLIVIYYLTNTSNFEDSPL